MIVIFHDLTVQSDFNTNQEDNDYLLQLTLKQTLNKSYPQRKPSSQYNESKAFLPSLHVKDKKYNKIKMFFAYKYA